MFNGSWDCSLRVWFVGEVKVVVVAVIVGGKIDVGEEINGNGKVGDR